MSLFPTRRDYGLNRMGRSFFDDQLFDSFFSNTNPIKTDIIENDEEYILEAELPGLDKEDIEITYENNVLTISAHKETGRDERDEESGQYIRRERSSQAFSRQFIVQNIKSDEIRADFDKGILTVVLPKQHPNQAQSKRIDIN